MVIKFYVQALYIIPVDMTQDTAIYVAYSETFNVCTEWVMLQYFTVVWFLAYKVLINFQKTLRI